MSPIEALNIPDDGEALVLAIREMQAKDGKLPSERDLADTLNVKRHQLRKALQSLRQSGEINPVSPRRGSTAQPRYGEELVRVTNPIEVLEMRLIMEPVLARLASLRASAFEIAQITAAATTSPEAAPGKADLNFHMLIVQAARNQLAGEFYKMLRQVGVDARMTVARTASPTCPKRIAARDAEHRRIADAIAQRDPEAAEAAMREHLHYVQTQIVARSRSFAA